MGRSVLACRCSIVKNSAYQRMRVTKFVLSASSSIYSRCAFPLKNAELSRKLRMEYPTDLHENK